LFHVPVRPLPTLPEADPLEVGDLDALFRGFADPIRIRIMNVLAAGELCVCDVVDVLGLPQSTVSRHLAYLRRMGLVEATREWKFAHYRLAEPANQVHANLVACVRSCFAGVPSLDRERAHAVKRAAARATEPC
jgi:ArsR family transcriptional regulator